MAKKDKQPMGVTAWTKWFLIFVEEKKVGTANNLADAWDPDGGLTTFGSVRLSADGQEPVSHYATSTPSTENMRDGITTALSVIPWAAMYWTDNIYPAEGLVHWTGPDGWTFEGPHGDVYPAWLAALEDMGLQRIQVDEFAVPDLFVLAEVVPEAPRLGWFARFRAWDERITAQFIAWLKRKLGRGRWD